MIMTRQQRKALTDFSGAIIGVAGRASIGFSAEDHQQRMTMMEVTRISTLVCFSSSSVGLAFEEAQDIIAAQLCPCSVTRQIPSLD